jgi:hypothetical protein
MNAKTRRLITPVAVVLTLCLFSSEHTTSAQSALSNCRNVRGILSEVSNANCTTGGITNGGILNGSTKLIFTSGVLATPDPTTVSYTDDFTVTTNRGTLKTNNVGLFDFANGSFTEIARIDPNASSGRFAGATGVLSPVAGRLMVGQPSNRALLVRSVWYTMGHMKPLRMMKITMTATSSKQRRAFRAVSTWASQVCLKRTSVCMRRSACRAS